MIQRTSISSDKLKNMFSWESEKVEKHVFMGIWKKYYYTIKKTVSK